MSADTCRHAWVAGMTYVHDEDLVTVARMRSVECERCDVTVGPHTPEATLFTYAYGDE